VRDAYERVFVFDRCTCTSISAFSFYKKSGNPVRRGILGRGGGVHYVKSAPRPMCSARPK